MEELFEQFRNWLSENCKEGLNDLAAPATDTEINQLQETIGFCLPQDLEDMLKIHNGQKGKGDTAWLLQGQLFLSSHKIIDEWENLKDLLDSGEFEHYSSPEPDNGIKNSWWNEKWLPFTINGLGDNLCIDMDPSTTGQKGQVITVWHDAGERKILSESLKEWFKSYISKLHSGEFVYSTYYKAIVPKGDE